MSAAAALELVGVMTVIMVWTESWLVEKSISNPKQLGIGAFSDCIFNLSACRLVQQSNGEGERAGQHRFYKMRELVVAIHLRCLST